MVVTVVARARTAFLVDHRCGGHLRLLGGQSRRHHHNASAMATTAAHVTQLHAPPCVRPWGYLQTFGGTPCISIDVLSEQPVPDTAKSGGRRGVTDT